MKRKFVASVLMPFTFFIKKDTLSFLSFEYKSRFKLRSNIKNSNLRGFISVRQMPYAI